MRAFATFSTTLLVLALWSAPPASAEMRLRPVYDPAGPVAAKGAVIFNHGKELDKDTPDTPQPYVEAFRDRGWDVFTLLRPVAEDRVTESARKLAAVAEGLKAQGYKRIVSVGQSYGGWISYAAAGSRPGLFHAVVATAPAAFGKKGSSWNWENNRQIASLAAGLQATRAMAFFFKGDEFDPGGRGTATELSLDRRSVPHLVVDEPAGYSGHGAANTLSFASEFGPCIVAFAEASEARGAFQCPRRTFEEVKANFPLPEEVTVPVLAADHAGAPGHPLVGAWHGWYQNGRELLLLVDEAGSPNALGATYAWGRQGSSGPGGWERLANGRLDPAKGTLSFSGTKASLHYALRNDGRADARWEKAGGGGVLTAVLTRVEPGSAVPLAASLPQAEGIQGSAAAVQ